MWEVNTEKSLRIFSRVYVSSDSFEIRERARELGAIPIERPKELCGDTPNISVYRHALQRPYVDCAAFIAVQANSPTVSIDLIKAAAGILRSGIQEVMTAHPDGRIYGSIWGMTRDRLSSYQDPHKPTPEILLVDHSIDIHTEEDLQKALCQKL